jgi:hypothetical protein
MSARICTRRVVVVLMGAFLVGHTFAMYRRIPWLRAATRCPLMILVAGYVASVSRGRRREVVTVVGGPSFLRGGALADAGRRPPLPAGYAVAYLAAAVPLHRFVLSDLIIALGLAGLRFRGQTAVVGATSVAGQLLLARHGAGSAPELADGA